MAALNDAQQAQVRDLINQRGGAGRKLSSLESVNGSDWRVWRNHFTTVAQINDWNDLRQRRELRAAMQIEAARLTADINVEAQGLTIADVLNAYQERFLPAAAGQVARVEFHAAKQLPDETVLQFHGRCRELFMRSYPEVNAPDDSVLLIQTFSLGLADDEISRYVLDRAPATFTEASNLAQTKAATEAALRFKRGQKGPFVGQMGKTENRHANLQCYSCGLKGHIKRNCRKTKGGKKGRGGWNRNDGKSTPTPTPAMPTLSAMKPEASEERGEVSDSGEAGN
jgi:hypothetical protein